MIRKHQLDGALLIDSEQSMFECVGGSAFRIKPIGRTPVQGAEGLDASRSGFEPEQIIEQLVIVIPLAVPLEAIDEEMAVGHGAQQVGAVGASGDGMGQRGCDSLDNAGVDEELANVGLEPAHHFVEEELGNRVFPTAERAEKLVVVVGALQ